MTTTTPSRTRKGFSLVELMIGASLGSVIVLAVLSSFLFIGRSGANLQNYTDMEAQARSSLEVFAEDVRQASSVTWNSQTNITLTVNTVAITYGYDNGTGVFNRTANGVTRNLMTGITPGSFVFRAFSISGAELPLATAANRTAATTNTKQLQITLEASRTSTTVVAATNTVLSARFILRNKLVTA